MIRTKGEAGTGDVVHAVKHIRQIVQEMKILTVLGEEELYAKAKEHGAPYELIRMVAKEGKLPVPNFSAGGIATPADASLVMQLGAEAVFVGSGIFMKDSTTFADPQEAEKRAKAIVQAATHYQDPKVLLEVSEDLVGAMKGLAIAGHRRSAHAADERLVTLVWRSRPPGSGFAADLLRSYERQQMVLVERRQSDDRNWHRMVPAVRARVCTTRALSGSDSKGIHPCRSRTCSVRPWRLVDVSKTENEIRQTLGPIRNHRFCHLQAHSRESF